MGGISIQVREAAAPPSARIAYRVGVVGHRPDRMPTGAEGRDAIRARLAQTLEAIEAAVTAFQASAPDAAFYSGETPALTATSPLAEGADRLFAEEALRLGYQLTCVMPFAKAEFEQDFRPGAALDVHSLAHFRDLLARAGQDLRVMEIDASPDHRAEAYQTAGRVVLNQSDLLVVIWDGGAAKGVGGTLDTLREAMTFEVPALWIDPRPPFAWRLLRSQDDLQRLSLEAGSPAWAPPASPAAEDCRDLVGALTALVCEELSLPQGDGAAQNRSGLSTYLAERKPRVNAAFAWKLVRDLLGEGRLHLPSLRVGEYLGQVEGDWPTRDDATQVGVAESWINGALRAHYAWSDKLADRYADAHRSGFIWSSLLAVTAVFVALLPMAAGWRAGRPGVLATAIVEAIVLILMVGLPFMAGRRRWHTRWMEYRVLAEMIRQLRILAPLGGGRPLPRTRAHLASYGDPTRSWMYWQMRAIGRSLRMPTASVDRRYLVEQSDYLLGFLGRGIDDIHGQIGFHHRNCERLESIHRRLHQATLTLFCLSIVGVLMNWVLTAAMGTSEPAWIGRWLILISAVFPALGAALASIDNQGEFARLQRRSRAMAERFADLTDRIAALRDSPALSLETLSRVAAEAAAMMVDENVDWRIVVLDLPHAAG